MRIKRRIYFISFLAALGFAGFIVYEKFVRSMPHRVGQVIDNLNGVKVYYNGKVGHVSGRNLTADNYNLGLRYQCVEFVKRYYYEHLNHKMPDNYGHAKDFFDKDVKDGDKNQKRGLIQYTNPGKSRPQPDDLLVFSATIFNRYGHVAIISKASDTEIEIIQQNPGKFEPSRKTIPLVRQSGKWEIANKRILGWLRKEADR